jgi:hypothetical protein
MLGQTMRAKRATPPAPVVPERPRVPVQMKQGCSTCAVEDEEGERHTAPLLERPPSPTQLKGCSTCPFADEEEEPTSMPPTWTASTSERLVFRFVDAPSQRDLQNVVDEWLAG